MEGPVGKEGVNYVKRAELHLGNLMKNRQGFGHI